MDEKLEMVYRFALHLQDDVYEGFEAIDEVFKSLGKHIKRQRRSNRGTKAMIICTAAGLYLMHKRDLEQDKKIKSLEKAIEEMNVMKGV